MSTPWGLLPPTDETVEGDFLIGYSMMWRTELARAVGFSEKFFGYSQGEDLFFSLLMQRHGKLLLAGAAHMHHLHDPSGRPIPMLEGGKPGPVVAVYVDAGDRVDEGDVLVRLDVGRTTSAVKAAQAAVAPSRIKANS